MANYSISAHVKATDEIYYEKPLGVVRFGVVRVANVDLYPPHDTTEAMEFFQKLALVAAQGVSAVERLINVDD